MNDKNITETYQVLLKNSLDRLDQASLKLSGLLDEAAERYSVAAEYSREELEHMAEYLKRDLHDAADYLEKNREEWNEWLGFDKSLIEQRFAELFSRAADATTLDLLELKDKAENQYRTGQISTLGTLACMQCGQRVHFHQPGRIPPCPQCKSTEFHRVYKNEENH